MERNGTPPLCAKGRLNIVNVSFLSGLRSNNICRIALLIAVLLVLACVGGVSAATYYVNPTGNDGDAGTSPATAWATLPGAETNATNGDTVWLAPGYYNGTTFSKSISWIGDSVDRTAIINSSTTPKTYTTVFNGGQIVMNVTIYGKTDTYAVWHTAGSLDIQNCNLTGGSSSIYRSTGAPSSLSIRDSTIFASTLMSYRPIFIAAVNRTDFISNEVISPNPAQTLDLIEVYGGGKNGVKISDNAIFQGSNSSATSAITIIPLTTAINTTYITGNTIFTNNTAGYIISVGSENTGANNNLCTEINVSWNVLHGVAYFIPGTSSTTHGVFVGHQANATISDNYVNGAGLAVAIKGSPITYYSGGISNNTLINTVANMGTIRIKGVIGSTVSRNTIQSTTTDLNPAIYITNNTGTSDYSINTHIEYNSVNTKSTKMVAMDDGSQSGFTAIKDRYNSTSVDPVLFSIGSTTLNLSEWRALGYDIIPIAQFTPTGSIEDISPVTVSFTDTSTGSPTSWDWLATPLIGAPSHFSALQNPTNIFLTGNYSVALTVSDGYDSNTSAATWINVSAAPVIPTPVPTLAGGSMVQGINGQVPISMLPLIVLAGVGFLILSIFLAPQGDISGIIKLITIALCGLIIIYVIAVVVGAIASPFGG